MDIKEILANIPNEGEENETLSDSPTDETVAKPQEGDDEKNETVNTPESYKERTSRRIQQLLRERNEEREKIEALEQRINEMGQSNMDTNIPERFVKLYGDDPEIWNEYNAMNQEQKEEWKAEVLHEINSANKNMQEEQERFVESYELQLDELEDSGRTFDRNKLMKFIVDRPIFRKDGQPDFETALDLMEAKKQSSNLNARKDIAGIGQQTTSSGNKSYYTPEDFVGY